MKSANSQTLFEHREAGAGLSVFFTPSPLLNGPCPSPLQNGYAGQASIDMKREEIV